MGTIAMAWWNLENLFDTDDDPISQDFEFTKANGWTEEAYAAKRHNLAGVLNNRQRRHSTLGYASPASHEQHASTAPAA
jgi:ABC-type proline/glycine betaine transport system substrate-binding protein